jgi:pimeloyl-ACP methyl ester carboxylesterase
MGGHMWDEPTPADLTLRLHNVAAAPTGDPAMLRVLLQTSRGEIQGLFHPVEGGSGAVIFVGGAMGGLDGPADRIFARLPARLAEAGVTSLRLDYRHPNQFDECMLDVLAGCSFLSGIGASGIVLVGHSFGAAVVIKAGQFSPRVSGVVAMSPQLYGTREVEQLGRPLLLIHGTEDSILSHEASEDIYRRALDPKEVVLLEGDGHGLYRSRATIDEILLEWIPARLAGEPATSGRREIALPAERPDQ